MKTILIATDFSRAARSAALYGVQLAKKLDAHIILFTAYSVAHPVAALNVHISHYDAMLQIEKKTREEADLINEGVGWQIEIICEEGTAEKLIQAIALEKNASLIVAGMKSKGKNMAKLLGSTITSLIKTLAVPVLVIPEGLEFDEPNIILYASDVFLDRTVQAINQIEWLVGHFKSKLYVVRVVKERYEELIEEVHVPQKLRAGLAVKHTSFEFPLDNITHGLNTFIETHEVDLLVMQPHKHDWIERLFVKSETRDMIFHSRIPLLILPETQGSIIYGEAAIDAGSVANT